MNTIRELARSVEAHFGRKEADFFEEIVEKTRDILAEEARLRMKDELREELMTQKDMAYIKAEFASIRREMEIQRGEMDDKLEAQKRNIDDKFEAQKRNFNDKFEAQKQNIDDKFDAQRREIEIRFKEFDKRFQIYMGFIIALLLLLHPSVGALIAKVFGV